jgi:hypothetical protein
MKKIHLLFLTTLLAVAATAQTGNDTTAGRFFDPLLDHLIGNWHDTSVAHEHGFTSEVDVNWVLNHQYVLIHLKSNEVVPWWHVQMEYYQYIGYNHQQQRYTVHGMSIEGDADLSEGFCYGYRDGNEFKVVAKFGADTNIVQRFTWEPGTGTWLVQSRPEIKGREGDVFLTMKLVAVKPVSK